MGQSTITNEIGGEYFALGIQNQLSFKRYLERLLKMLENQYYMVFQAIPEKECRSLAPQYLNRESRMSKLQQPIVSGFLGQMSPRNRGVAAATLCQMS
jgi:hypothetical protein